MLISRDLVVAIVNDDYSGLTREEKNQLDDFLERNKIRHVVPISEDTVFVKCRVTRLYSDCLEVDFKREEL